MKNGHINFTDTPCSKNQKTVNTVIIKPIVETHTVATKYVQDDIVISSPRIESNELIDNERRKEAKKDNDWNSLPPLGSTPYKNPYTYGNTHFYR
ncbi:MAG: hypothetical protein KGO49_01365 [Gammaproteobacteria bacterium]|nr:hypothetical protein [Gammaproteobacteria bacterium]